MTAEWTLNAVQKNGTLELNGPEGYALHFRPALCLDKTGDQEDKLELLSSAAGRLTYKCPEAELTLELLTGSKMPRLGLKLKNITSEPLRVRFVAPLKDGVIKSPATLNRYLLNGSDMNGQSDLVVADKDFFSFSVAGFTDTTGDHAVVLGFEQLKDASYRFDLNPGSVSANCDREGTPIAPGAILEISPLAILTGNSLTELMEAYADQVAEVMNARKAPVKAGWCSWYTYYGTETFEEVVENVEALAKWRAGKHINIIQIDDGWNLPEPDSPRSWGDWMPGSKFKKGMKAIVDEIKARGYEAGLWLAPFSVEKPSNVFKEHPEWLVQNEDGSGPKSFWGVYGFDLTNPEAIEYIKSVFRRVFDEWGFTYVKIDFLIHAVQPGLRKDNSLTTVEVFRRGVEAIREVARDRYILHCGSLKGPSVGVCDAMRIGPDVSHRWYIPMNLENWPVGNCSIYSGAVHTTWRQWMHGRLWQNDPDCLLVHDDGTKGEKGMFNKEFDRVFAENPPWGLSDEEAGMWVRLIWMTGGLAMIGEDVAILSEERSALLAEALPVNPHPGRVIDSYENPRVYAVESKGDKHRVGVFNLTDSEETLTISASKLGLGDSWSFRERISGETFQGSGAEVRFPALPARSGRIWELQS